MTAARAGSARLLIVDDQAANVRVLGEALKERYELFFATSGEAALALLENNQIDLALLDVTMPGLDGFEVCRRLKADERTRKLPVIFVTARGEVEDEARGFDVGGVDYITKPISPPIVRARVRTHLELKQARDLLEEMAFLDPLTGIPNRRRFDGVIAREWRRALRDREPLSVALLDVDHFKSFNDRYGHARGDDCLRSVAQALAAACRRPGDLVARYGGEEFALLLPDTDAAGARALIATLLGGLRDLGIEHAASSCAGHVTLSVGGITLVPAGEARPGSALERADALLYAAKAAGRFRGEHLDAASGQQQAVLPQASKPGAE